MIETPLEELESVLANLADGVNTLCREEGAAEVGADYQELGVMKRVVEELVYRMRRKRLGL